MSRRPTHPGEILKDELVQIGISAAELSRQLKVPENRVGELIRGKRGITADTALRLGKWFGTSAAFWMNLQKNYDLWQAEHGSKEWQQVKPLAQQLLHSNI